LIAIAGPDLPHEVLLAAVCHAGPIAFDPERDTPQALQWVESKFAPWAFAVVEGWAEGAYDGLEAVLFSRADDSSQRLYYYICELQRRGLLAGPEPLICDIAKIPRASSVDRTAFAVRKLAQRLGVDDKALEAAIVTTNQRRSAVPSLAEGRRCLLTGTPPPDDRLHRAIAAQGFVPVGSTLAEDWADLGDPVAEGSGDPAQAIARGMHARQSGSRSFADPETRLRATIDACRASAVVLWRIEEEEAQCWHLPAERRALDEAGVPALVLTRRDWLARDGAAAEIAAFLSEITP
jgi:hypothetical protein